MSTTNGALREQRQPCGGVLTRRGRRDISERFGVGLP